MFTQQDLEKKYLEIKKEAKEELDLIHKYWRLTCYLVVAQIYLKANPLLKDPLKKEHIKDRLLGHFGTSPGINLVYAHLNRLINEHKLDMFLITGPGHGAPANLANLYLERSLEEYYPKLTLNYPGLEEFVKWFSWPGGFPSHLYPGIPGTIHEGGELGYALATSFGAVLDNPNLIVACIVGDGESETGPTATAWHSTKFLDPKESGAVLPIVHINGYKISNPTIYGTMSNEELTHLFKGYGYEPLIVEGEDLDAKLYTAMDLSYQMIKEIQKHAREDKPLKNPQWPVILLRSLKGMGGLKEVDGVKMEGNCKSHQVPVRDPKTNSEHFKLLEEWLKSYRVEELVDPSGRPNEELLKLCPSEKLRMGTNPHTFGDKKYQALNLPSLFDFEVKETNETEEMLRGRKRYRNVEELSFYLREVFKRNHNIRIFSPDELESNKLGSVFEETHRDYQWPTHPWDTNISSKDGKVLEILSEHTCQGWLQGYLLTGRHGMFPSYEAFLGIVATMMDQFAKFLKISKEVPFRGKVASLNYLETSTLWRQEHNGFSHQSPGFINTVLNKKADVARVYLPPDANCLISTFNHCLHSKGYVNLVIAGKQKMPQWLSMQEAIDHCRSGASIWDWASSHDGVDPDVTLCGIGDIPTLEVMAAAKMLKHQMPELRFRVVNVTDLFVLEKESLHPHGLDEEMFESLFTNSKPVIFNFHGYPSVVKQLLYGRDGNNRFTINGYIEEGTTTTPFDMVVRNHTSRYHLIMQAIRLAAKHNSKVAPIAQKWISHFEYELQTHKEYIEKNGVDPKEITDWQWD